MQTIVTIILLYIIVLAATTQPVYAQIFGKKNGHQPINQATFYDDLNKPSPPSSTSNLLSKYDFYSKIRQMLPPEWTLTERQSTMIITYYRNVVIVPDPDDSIVDADPKKEEAKAKSRYATKPYEIEIRFIPSTTPEYVPITVESETNTHQQVKLDELYTMFDIKGIYLDEDTRLFTAYTTDERNRLAKYLLAREYLRKQKYVTADPIGPIPSENYFIIDNKVEFDYVGYCFKMYPEDITQEADGLVEEIKKVLMNHR